MGQEGKLSTFYEQEMFIMIWAPDTKGATMALKLIACVFVKEDEWFYLDDLGNIANLQYLSPII